MERDSKRWVEVNPSPFPWERDGQHFIRENLPDIEPYRAWANVEFIADDGSINEIDLLVVGRTGVFLVELKGWPGRISGDAQRWRWTPPERDAKPRTYDNPLLLTNRKAKKLKSLLAKQKALRDLKDRLFIEPVVFLSDPHLECQLLVGGRTNVFGRGMPAPTTAAFELPSILDLLRGNEAVRPGKPMRRVDAPMSRAFAEAVEQAGIRPSAAARRVGDFDLEELLDEDEGWQDWAAVHRGLKVQRRIRIWLAGITTSVEERDRLTRAAQREVRLLEGLDHPGILRPVAFTEHDYGPCLVFERDPTAERLDDWLANRGEHLTIDTRLHVVRQLAETLAFAHRHELFHRGLTPRCVVVSDPDSAEPRLRIGDWQTGVREASTAASVMEGTRHLGALLAGTANAYLAPETVINPAADPRHLDVFALGAVALHVLSGKPPAATADELRSILALQGSLELGAVQDGASEALALLVRGATAADPTDRLGVDEVLEYLDLAVEELTGGPDPVAAATAESEPVDPLAADRGDVLEGGWRVERRLGTGSTARALLAERAGRKEVLKVALDPDHDRRLHDEFEVLQIVRHKSIVAAYDLDDIGGHRVLHLELAGEQTLGQRLRQDGRLGLDLLERWGGDLFAVLEVLEREGVAHRDIKPDNLGIAPRKPNDELHLVLFDFSLARAPADALHVGTPGYLDPFLVEREVPRFDLQAERWSLAVVLHEMAAGERPGWRGGVDPLTKPDLEVTVATDLLDPAVADALTEFFTVALRRDARLRFGSLDEMRRAWHESFGGTDAPVLTVTDHTGATGPVLPTDATRATPLVELGLTPRALDALDRLGIATVGDLLGRSLRDLQRMRGVGDRTRKELTQTARLVQGHFAAVEPEAALTALATSTDTDEDLDVDAHSVDRLAALCLPRATKANTTDVRVQELLLGLAGSVRTLDGADDELPTWPSQTDVARHVDVTRARVGQLVAKARERWRRQVALRKVRDELNDVLLDAGGVLAAAELADVLLGRRGSAAPDVVRQQRARAVVRAAIEADQALSEPRWVQKRSQGRLVIAVDDGDVEGVRLAEWAIALGDAADHLAAQDPLPSTATVLERLRAIDAPAGAEPLADARLIRTAAVCSTNAATSSRLDLYPRDLDPVRALRLARPALLGVGTLTIDAVHARLRARFPHMAPLPDRPDLDQLLAQAGIELTWHDDPDDPLRAGYRLPAPLLAGFTSLASSTTVLATLAASGGTLDERTRAIADLDDRLRREATTGGFLALTVTPKRLATVEAVLAATHDARLVSADAVLLAAMHAKAAAMGVDWDLVLRADAAEPGSVDAANLRELVKLAAPDLRAELLAAGPTVALTDLELLARYGHLALLEQLRDHVNGIERIHGAALKTLWVVVPATDPQQRPMVGDQALAVLTSNEWLVVPDGWGRHDAYARSS